jgi:hypothetical protein
VLFGKGLARARLYSRLQDGTTGDELLEDPPMQPAQIATTEKHKATQKRLITISSQCVVDLDEARLSVRVSL